MVTSDELAGFCGFDNAEEDPLAEMEPFLKAFRKIELIMPEGRQKSGMWYFHVEYCGRSGKFAVSTTDIEKSPAKFKELFAIHLKVYPPEILTAKPKKNEVNVWKAFKEFLIDNHVEVHQNESDAWGECNALLNKIANFRATFDKYIWSDDLIGNNVLLETIKDGVTYVVIKKRDIGRLHKVLGLNEPLKDIGDVANIRDIKRTGDPEVKVGKKREYSNWWIKREVLEEFGYSDKNRKLL